MKKLIKWLWKNIHYICSLVLALSITTYIIAKGGNNFAAVVGWLSVSALIIINLMLYNICDKKTNKGKGGKK